MQVPWRTTSFFDFVSCISCSRLTALRYIHLASYSPDIALKLNFASRITSECRYINAATFGFGAMDAMVAYLVGGPHALTKGS